MKRLFVLILLFGTIGHAGTSSDDLLSSLGEKSSENETAKVSGTTSAEDPSWDSFQKYFAARSRELNFRSIDMNHWKNLVLEGQFTQAAHLWSALQNQIPAAAVHDAQAVQLYLLWKLDLSQTFLNQWLRALADKNYAHSEAEQALEKLTAANLDSCLLRKDPVLSEKQEAALAQLPNSKTFVATLRAWGHLRDVKMAKDLLATLPADNQLIPPLVHTAVFGFVKEGKLLEAGKILKKYAEPHLVEQKNLDLLADDDLAAARILFQAGQLRASSEFYKKIPNQSPLYLTAQEELAWVYLRMNDSDHLRGLLKGLSAPVFGDHFAPEVFLLRAISDLKMCYYEAVEGDLAEFKKSNLLWAKRIDQALAGPTAPPPASPDFFSRRASGSVEHLESEKQNLVKLEEQSIGASIPAVGPQRHWKDALADLQGDLELARKSKNNEFTRQWRNQKNALQESIRKALFVKVEYANQVRDLANESETVRDHQHLVASNDAGTTSSGGSAGLRAKKDEMVFPVDSDIWTDELFKLRSAAQAQCLKKKEHP